VRCPYCNNAKTKVIDSRCVEEGGAIRRRRQCKACDSRFTTFERRESVAMMVVKRNGAREPYDRQKLASGMHKACSKRKVAAEAIDRSIIEIEEEIMKGQGQEISASEIGGMVMEKLRGLDEIAYVRFASVYKRFGDVSEFQKELGDLTPEDVERPAEGEKARKGVEDDAAHTYST
jgi:transcriptional repressor NrdR